MAHIKPGSLFVISAPSGAGKTTICRRLLVLRKDLRYSISCTTRRPRTGETDGKAYFFLSTEEFKKRIAHSEFLEWAVVHEAYYGTPRRYVEATLREGHDVVMAIDIQGAVSVRRKFPAAVLIFVMPPSIHALKERLDHRREDPAAAAKRIASSRHEVAAAKDYDFVVVNEDLSKAVSQISSIMTAQKLRVERREAVR